MKQTLRAKIYGDSIMKGTILDAGYRYHAIMNEYLIKLYDRFGIEAEKPRPLRHNCEAWAQHTAARY